MAPLLTPIIIEHIRNGPAASPPPGIHPNYDNPPNGNALAIGEIIASLVLATIVGLCRLYSRVFCTKKVKLEDYIALAAFPFFIAGTWELTKIPHETGFFVHQWNLRVYELEGFLHTYILSTTLYCVSLLLMKIAILLEWSHIFIGTPQRNAFWWICYGMMILSTGLYVATIIAITFACSPRERTWRRYLPGTCININAFNIIIASLHLAFDAVMLLLPQTVIWRLNLVKKHKIGISVVFLVGVLACVWAAGRVVAAHRLTHSQDSSYEYSNYILWGLAEVATAELVFCAPAFPVLFRKQSALRKACRLLKNKMITGTTTPSETSSAETRQKPRRKFTVFDLGSEVAITRLEPVKIEGGISLDEPHGSTSTDPRGILVTTVIDVKPYEEDQGIPLEKVRIERA
ncbi:hypothetical protein F5Y14DRAFT_448310 [Nemania sp. NC0429]|nr:hypothetical protein F5Y14DRAFT_448310 [Nemania sp. NC0429]